MKRKLLETLQEACDLITEDYQKENGKNNIKFCVLQLSNAIKNQSDILRTDLVRQAAQLYDEYEGNEDYIHIPDINQMLHNLQQYPVLGALNAMTGELEGVITLKYHENSSKDKIDPYYPKENVHFFSITGVIVKQRKDILHKGLGSSLYAASILGIQKYASEYLDENMELNAVIDCTNLPSLYALKNGNKKIERNNYIGANQKLEPILDGIYTVRDAKYHLVEAPTYVIKIPLIPKESTINENNDEIFNYTAEAGKIKHRQYETILDCILDKIKREKSFNVTKMEDEGTGIVDYIHTDDLEIYLESMKLERNGTENIGEKRIPRRDVPKFVGPMPDFRTYIEEEER